MRNLTLDEYLEAVRAVFRCERPHCTCHSDAFVHCPLAESHRRWDRKPSLAINAGSRQPIVMNCRVCTDSSTVFHAVVTTLAPYDLSLDGGPARRNRDYQRHDACDHGAVKTRYHYYGLDGSLMAIKERVTWASGDKKFFLCLPDGSPSKQQLHYCDLPLYGLPALLETKNRLDREGIATPKVLIVEGEKCVEVASEKGFLPVSLPGSASQQKFGDALEPLRGCIVVLVPDNDGPGIALMQRLGLALQDVAAEIRWLFLGGVMPKGDLVDYFDMGGTAEDLKARIESAPLFDPTSIRLKQPRWHRPRGPRTPKPLQPSLRERILDAVAHGIDTRTSLIQAVRAHPSSVKAWLDRLIAEGALEREGTGKRGSRFRYRLSSKSTHQAGSGNRVAVSHPLTTVPDP